MTTFENFYQDLLEFTKKYEEHIPLKIEKDLDNNIIKIFGEKITSLARAKNGLNDVAELAYATAEHHPYWNLLYNCSEIANSVLDKWGDSLEYDGFGPGMVSGMRGFGDSGMRGCGDAGMRGSGDSGR